MPEIHDDFVAFLKTLNKHKVEYLVVGGHAVGYHGRPRDTGDIDGAIKEFKKTISLDSSAAGAYYNIALGYGKKGERDAACDYAYQAGKIYLKNKNTKQATRMVVFIKNTDPSSSLVEKLRAEITKHSP